MNKTGRIVTGVASATLIAIAAALAVAMVALVWLYGFHRSADGYVTGPVVSLTSDGYAIASADIELDSFPEYLVPSDLFGDFRVEAESETDSDLFIGVGPLDDVRAYLDDVQHSDVTRFGDWSGTTYVVNPGSSIPELPGSQDFWTETAEGPGLLSLDWQPQAGAWTLVVMNSDASPGVDISTSVGIDNPWIPLGIAVTGIGALLSGIVAAVLAVFALRRSPTTAVETSEEPELATIGS